MMSFHHNPPGSLPHCSVTVEEVEGTPLMCKIEPSILAGCSLRASFHLFQGSNRMIFLGHPMIWL